MTTASHDVDEDMQGPASRDERSAAQSQRAWTRQRRLIVDTLVLGFAGAAAAQAFGLLLRLANDLLLGRIAGYRAPGLPSEGASSIEMRGPHGLWLIPVVTTLGGLAVGLLTTWLAPEAEGHGTDAVVRAFHRAGGRLRGRVAPVKLVASAITIGSGGSAGREGPIALITAGVGSWYAGVTKRDERDRRLLLLVGAAAGLSAVFRSPIGAAIFVIEVLYADMDFEAGVLLYATLASILAYALNGMIVGWDPLFRMPGPVALLRRPVDYGWYGVLGIAAGILAVAVPVVFYRVRDFFRALPIPPALKPALGGLGVGLIALALPQVIGGGYGWIQRAIDGQIALGLLLTLAVAKLVAMSLTVASGGSGGVFAPTLFVGAMLGGACAAVAHLPPAPFVVVGMAAVFAGSAHVPIATLIMVTEMTGGYTLLVPAALAVMISYLVQMRLGAGQRYRSVYEAQVAARADSPAHHTQHLETALRILHDNQFTDLGNIGEVDLPTLLRSGIPVELAGGRRLFVGSLRADSPVVGTTVGASGRQLAGADTNVIGILRGEQMLVPRADTVLEARDRLIVVANEDTTEGLRAHLDPW